MFLSDKTDLEITASIEKVDDQTGHLFIKLEKTEVLLNAPGPYETHVPLAATHFMLTQAVSAMVRYAYETQLEGAEKKYTMQEIGLDCAQVLQIMNQEYEKVYKTQEMAFKPDIWDLIEPDRIVGRIFKVVITMKVDQPTREGHIHINFRTGAIPGHYFKVMAGEKKILTRFAQMILKMLLSSAIIRSCADATENKAEVSLLIGKLAGDILLTTQRNDVPVARLII